MRVLAALLLLPTVVLAQQPGTIVGRVHDSLLVRGALPGAEVAVLGLPRTAIADSAGRFRLDSLPPGRWRLTFTHPALEAARLTAPSTLVEVLEGEAAEAVLTTPGDQTLYRKACPAPHPAGTGLLVGLVQADTMPAAGATVRVFWRAWTLEPGRDPEEQPREASVVLDATGRFSVCGVPTDRAVTLAAGREERRAVREVRLEGRAFGVVQLDLAAPTAAGTVAAVVPDAAEVLVVGAEADRGLTLRGRVRDRSGAPLRDARVTVVGAEAVAATRDDGSFQFTGLAPGTVTVEVSRIGYVPRRVEVPVAPDRLQRADVMLEQVAYVLQPLTAKGATDPRRAGLERRLRSGNGQYLTEAQIRQRRALSVSDLLKGMNGVQVRTTGMSTVIVMTRSPGALGRSLGGACIPAYFVDGSLVGSETQGDAGVDSLLYSSGSAPAGFAVEGGTQSVGAGGVMPRDVGPDQFVQIGDIETLEVYTSAAFIPAEFAQYNGGCGIVAIWTRRGLPTVIEEGDAR